jgi:hypothetical protein
MRPYLHKTTSPGWYVLLHPGIREIGTETVSLVRTVERLEHASSGSARHSARWRLIVECSKNAVRYDPFLFPEHGGLFLGRGESDDFRRQH